jgi:transposase
MLSLGGGATRVYLAAGPTDLRKSFDSLSALVAGPLGGDPSSGHLFVFCNRRRDRIKVLYWDRTGLWVLAKRLEGGRYWWPGAAAAGACPRVELSAARLAALLDGLDLSGARGRRGWYRR